jgi:hypothetical protein
MLPPVAARNQGAANRRITAAQFDSAFLTQLIDDFEPGICASLLVW